MIKKLFKRNGNNRNLPNPLRPGTKAPDFSLPSTTGENLSLDELRGEPVVLVFYPADQSPVCSNQLTLYNEALGLFGEHDAQLVGLSTDNLDSHENFARSLNLKFPLLADDDPTGDVAQAYGVYNPGDGQSERALFVIDDDGIIRWSHIVPRSVNPGANGILEALDSLAEKPLKSEATTE